MQTHINTDARFEGITDTQASLSRIYAFINRAWITSDQLSGTTYILKSRKPRNICCGISAQVHGTSIYAGSALLHSNLIFVMHICISLSEWTFYECNSIKIALPWSKCCNQVCELSRVWMRICMIMHVNVCEDVHADRLWTVCTLDSIYLYICVQILCANVHASAHNLFVWIYKVTFHVCL